MSLRNFATHAVQTTLTEAVSATDLTGKVAAVTGWPTPPFTVILDSDRTSEEVVEVTDISGLTLTWTRAVDGSPALPHEAGASAIHGVSARDFREPNTHVNATNAVHGVTGAVVGTTDAQVLDAKTFTSTSGSSAPLTVKQAVGQSGNLIEVLTSTNVLLGYMDANGKFLLPQLETTQSAVMSPTTASTTALTLKGKAGQSADIMRVQDSSGNILFSVGPTGNAYAPNLTQDTLNTTSVVATSVSTGTLTATGQSQLAAVAASSLSTTGTITGAGLNASGSVTAASLSLTGSATVGGSVTATGAVTGASGTFSGNLLHHSTMPVPRIAAGTTTVSVSASSTGNAPIVFPASRFSQAPVVTVSLASAPANSGKLSARVLNTTSTGASIYVYTGDLTNVTAAVTVNWIAVQMTDGAAAG